MPMFFFDSSDGDHFLVDEYGVDLHDEIEARDHAVVLVQSLVVDTFPNTEAKTIAVTVRSVYGPVYSTQYEFIGVWTREVAPMKPILL